MPCDSVDVFDNGQAIVDLLETDAGGFTTAVDQLQHLLKFAANLAQTLKVIGAGQSTGLLTHTHGGEVLGAFGAVDTADEGQQVVDSVVHSRDVAGVLDGVLLDGFDLAGFSNTQLSFDALSFRTNGAILTGLGDPQRILLYLA